MRLITFPLLLAMTIALSLHGMAAWWLWHLRSYESIKPVELMSMEWVEDKPDLAVPPKVETSAPAVIESVDEPEPVMTQEVAPPPLPPKVKTKPQPVKPAVSKVPVAQASQETQTESLSESSLSLVSASPASLAVEQKPLVRAEADYLNNPKPSYPRLSKRMGEQGEVRLRVLVGVDGRVVSVGLGRSSGFERLDESAIESVKTWRFKPASQGGEALETWVEVPIKFVLENE